MDRTVSKYSKGTGVDSGSNGLVPMPRLYPYIGCTEPTDQLQVSFLLVRIIYNCKCNVLYSTVPVDMVLLLWVQYLCTVRTGVDSTDQMVWFLYPCSILGDFS